MFKKRKTKRKITKRKRPVVRRHYRKRKKGFFRILIEAKPFVKFLLVMGLIAAGFSTYFAIRGFLAPAQASNPEPIKNIPEIYTDNLEVISGSNTLTVKPVEGNPVRVKKEDVRYIYEKAYKNTDIIQDVYPYKIKEQLVFSNPGHPLVFKYELGNLDNFKVEKDKEGNINFYDKEKYGKNKELSRVFTIPVPFIEDKTGKRSFSAVNGYIGGNLFIVEADANWLQSAAYPVVLDPTIEINILNVHSHPQQGDNWEVEFNTKGTGDLRIIPDDQATIDDDEFIGLYCDGERRIPQILAGDVIYYPSWQCDGTGKVVHYTKKAGKHTLRFEFGGQTAYAYNDSAEWLSGWDKRVKLTIDHNDITSDLSNFPILVYLSASSGRGPDDISFVFDEVGANSKKIAVTKSDGTAQCYVEIEKWDSVGEQAWLWVNVSGTNSISPSTDTDLYLYYDVDHADNTDYVGDPDSTPAKNVWDSNHVMVQHMHTTSWIDSTTNTNNGTSNGDVTTTTSGKIDSAGTFDGTGDYVEIGSSIKVDNSQTGNISLWVNLTALPTTGRFIGYGGGAKSYAGKFWLGIKRYLSPTVYNIVYMQSTDSETTATEIRGSTNIGSGAWYYVSMQSDGSAITIYVNGAAESLTTVTGSDNGDWLADTTVIETDASTIGVGKQNGSLSNYINGQIDEVRISNTARSAAWIKAEYETDRDDFLDFGSEELAVSNTAPAAVSVSDDPDPVTVGSDVTFSGEWTESDSGDIDRMYICKTSDCTDCNETTQTGCWCYSSSDQTEPDVSDTCSYTAQTGDIGAQSYWLGVCDDEPSCDDTPLSGGTFTVQAAAPESVRIKGGFKAKGGMKIKF